MIRDKHFMVDIEATGVNIGVDKILEIGLVEMLPTDDGFWRPGKEYQTYVHCNRAPMSQFARENMAAVYLAANNAPKRTADQIRAELVAFFEGCGKVGHEVLLCGWNASNFDVPMLNWADYLIPPGYETVDGKDSQVGDHHYRVYEMCGAIQVMADIKQMSYTDVKEAAKNAFDGPPLPSGKAHDAIYDCHSQIKLLNGIIALGRQP